MELMIISTRPISSRSNTNLEINFRLGDVE